MASRQNIFRNQAAVQIFNQSRCFSKSKTLGPDNLLAHCCNALSSREVCYYRFGVFRLDLLGHQSVGKTALSNALVESRKECSCSYRMVRGFIYMFPKTIVPKLNVRNIHLQDVNADVVNQITSTNHFKEFLIYDYPGSPVYHDLFDKFVSSCNTSKV